MTQNRNTLQTLETLINQTLQSKTWTSFQHRVYQLLARTVNKYQEDNRIFEVRDDKMIMRTNLVDQYWFNNSKAKPIISQLLDVMNLVNYSFIDDECCIHLYVLISFKHFRLHGCLYRNKINQYTNYYIFVDQIDQPARKAYLVYYTYTLGFTPTENMKKMAVPEFDKLYAITQIDPDIFPKYELLTFFAEIILYYDDTESMGQLPIGYGVSATLNQIINLANHPK